MAELIVNTSRMGLQHQPAIATFGGSHFLVVWNDSTGFSIKARLIQADGLFSSDEIVVSSEGTNTQRQFPVAFSTGGGPVAAWIESAVNPPGPRPHVKLRRFGREGRPIGEEIQVSTDDVDPDQRPAIASMIDGGFVVVWADARREQRIRGQRFSSEGIRKGGELAISTTEGFHERPAAVRLLDGNYVVSWRNDPAQVGGGALMFRSFDLEGAEVLAETRPNLSGFQGSQALTFLDDGRFVIVHVRRTGVSDIGVETGLVEAHVMAQDTGGVVVPIGVSASRGLNVSSPAAAALPGGRFMVSWVQKSADTFSTTPVVKARMFSGIGESVGAEVDVSSSTPGSRRGTSAATMFGADGANNGCIAWTQETSGPAGTLNLDIVARLVTTSDSALAVG